MGNKLHLDQTVATSIIYRITRGRRTHVGNRGVPIAGYAHASRKTHRRRKVFITIGEGGLRRQACLLAPIVIIHLDGATKIMENLLRADYEQRGLGSY